MNETKKFIMNERISYLYDKLDFQDAIINKQILEISQLQQRIDKAIEYIKENTLIDYYGMPCFNNQKNIEELLEILEAKYE